MTKPDPKASFPRKFGKYHLLAPLAQGGMGALYLAVTGDVGFERMLVIKTVLPHLADSEYLGRFRDEAKVVVQLSHGNLIPVFDAGQVEGEIFLAMEFVEGKDLRAVWNRCAKKGVAFPVDVAVFLVKELCRGLDYAHSFRDLKLVHRDVSPPNVLISYSGEVKLTDWGLASSTLKLEKTAPGIIYGKVAYMSPEQARGESLDGRSDLYAAGIILWELLTGRQLFPPGKDQPQELIKRARNPRSVPPSLKAPRVPPTLDEVCLKALSPDVDDRYSTGEEFRVALAEWLAKESPTTDSVRLEKFLSKLFGDDIENERKERKALIEKTHERIKTLPPTHELRKLLEAQGTPNLDLAALDTEASDANDRRQKTDGPNLGRRNEDRGEPDRDRRTRDGRRSADGSKKRPRSHPRPASQPVVNTDSAQAALVAEEEAQPTPVDVMGQVLDDRYRIVELIGEGGMGRVYMAEHVEIGKRVAVKVLHPVYSRMPELVERFRREARAASRIGHPHIVDVTDSGTTSDGSVYFVMEYLEGVELAHVIDREGALDVSRALKIATQICRALAGAHAVNIIHRDLKPENVFLTVREGTSDFVKVLDFGIAKSGEAEEARNKRLTHPGMAMGTPEYMAPEQAAGRPADERTDIYAVGAILYEMVTGVPPYDGDNFMEILTKKATVEPTPPSQLRPEVPVLVDDLVLHAMARQPEERPPSMEAFEYELTKCLSGRGAAVAKILGMPTDPALIASLNPGASRSELKSNPPELTPIPDAGARFGGPTPLPKKRESSGAEVILAEDSAAHAPGGPVSESHVLVQSPALMEAPTATSRAKRDTDMSWDPDQTGTINVPAQKSTLGMVGWVLFVLFLLAGGSAMYFVVLGESTSGGEADSARQAASGHNEGAVDPPTPPPPENKTDEKQPNDPENPTDPGDKTNAAKQTDPDKPPVKKEPAKDKDKIDKRKAPPVKKARAPRNAKEARLVLKDAQKAVNAGNWTRAKELYTLVIKGGKLKSSAYIGLAKVAFETKQWDQVIEYAGKSGRSRKARMLRGHAFKRKKMYEAAANEYRAVLRKNPKDQEAKMSLASIKGHIKKK